MHHPCMTCRRRQPPKPEPSKQAAQDTEAARGPKLLTPQQRLAAFQLRVRSTERAAAGTGAVSARGSRREAPRRYKKPTDPDYIGGGMYAPTPELMAVWLAMRPHVEALVRVILQ